MLQGVFLRPASGFKSRTREGATSQLQTIKTAIHVSIHAPVRVRLSNLYAEWNLHSFNSRTREGATSATLP